MDYVGFEIYEKRFQWIIFSGSVVYYVVFILNKI